MKKFLITEDNILTTYSNRDTKRVEKYLKVLNFYNSEKKKNISKMTKNFGIPRRTFYYWANGIAPKPIKCINWLKDYHLIPFSGFNLINPHHEILFDIYAFIFGDGSLDKTYIELSGERESLHIIERKFHKFFPDISTNMFKTAKKAYSLFIYSAYLARFLIALGCPAGDKQSKKYLLPLWLTGNKILAKRWLEIFFGNEGVKISKRRRIARLEQYKIIELEDNILIFLNQVKQMLERFGIKSYISMGGKAYLRKKDNKEVKGYYLKISRDKLNIYRLLNTLKYRYSQHKQIENDKTLRYFKKDFIFHINRFMAYDIAQYLKRKNYSKSRVKEMYNQSFLSKMRIPWRTFYDRYFLNSFTPKYYQRCDEIKVLILK